MAYVVHHPFQYLNNDLVGEGVNLGECAQLAQLKWASHHKVPMPMAMDWRAGKRLIDCKPGELTPGTVLATFDAHGKYLNKHGCSHTVLYVSLVLDKNGRPNLLNVIHQYKDIQPALIQHACFHFGPNHYHFKDARNYSVVESQHGASGRW